MEILTAVRDWYTPAAVLRLASYRREQEACTRRGIDQSIPTVVAAIVKLIAKPVGAQAFLDTLADSHHHRSMLSELPAVLSSRHAALAMLALGEKCRAQLFGDLERPVAQAIAQESALSLESALDILSLTTLLTLEVVGQDSSHRGLMAVEILEEVSRLRPQAARALPVEVAKHIELYADPASTGAATPQGPRVRLPWLAKLFA